MGRAANVQLRELREYRVDAERRRNAMPRIRITTEPRVAREAAVVLDERIVASDLTSRHFTAALIERIGWAVADADQVEHERRQEG